jgi:hypothetical protein
VNREAFALSLVVCIRLAVEPYRRQQQFESTSLQNVELRWKRFPIDRGHDDFVLGILRIFDAYGDSVLRMFQTRLLDKLSDGFVP